ncbi:MAG TPA: phytanoyl-CoA dioxygenase family protein [Burkholderiaceae bacterium]|jgi:hypothetical protein|nr:phytanoyl-CoA dioxygenase family protein [Burkholderiaceae bacterium]
MTSIQLASRTLLSATEASEHAYHVQTRGYSIIEGFLLPSECELLRHAMLEANARYKPIAGSERSALDANQLHDLMATDINFARLLEDPRLQQLVAPHLGEHWIMYAATSSSIPPRGKNYASRLHVDSPRFVPGWAFNMGLIWTLTDYTVENGAVKVLPGSHHCEAAPSEDLFERNCIQVTCKAGALIIFNARLFHRTAPNFTDHWRHSMTVNACRSFMKQRMDWVRFIPVEIAAQLNDQARRLIGYDTRLPSSLEEFFVPEEKRLYKANQG